MFVEAKSMFSQVPSFLKINHLLHCILIYFYFSLLPIVEPLSIRITDILTHSAFCQKFDCPMFPAFRFRFLFLRLSPQRLSHFILPIAHRCDLHRGCRFTFGIQVADLCLHNRFEGHGLPSQLVMIWI